MLHNRTTIVERNIGERAFQDRLQGSILTQWYTGYKYENIFEVSGSPISFAVSRIHALKNLVLFRGLGRSRFFKKF